MKKAIIVGSKGQDGLIMEKYLIARNYRIISISKNNIQDSESVFLNKLFDITNINDVEKLIKKVIPDEIYFFAAYHHSSEDKKLDNHDVYVKSSSININALENFLHAIYTYSPKAKLFYAASSMIYSDTTSNLQDETTSFSPNSIYGITKLAGLLLCRFYREKYNIFACVGIFYNHESEFRKEKFLSKKIITGALKIKNGIKNKITLGDLKSEVDWGYAPDYIDACYKMMQLNKAYELIISTGEKHSVENFVETTFKLLNMDWKKYIFVDKSILSRKMPVLIGNSNKLKKLTSWKPSVTFEEMIKIMLIKEGAQINE